MKKLMIAAAVAALGLAVNAASTSWSIDDVALPTGMEDATAYLIMADSAAVTGWGAMSVTAATDALKAGEFDSVIANALQNKSGEAGVSIFDYYNEALGFDNSQAQVINNNQEAAAYLLLVSDDGSKALIVDTADPIYYNATGGNDGYAFGDIKTYASNGDNWISATAAPEPTSGLLLLLGVAGLALRRRRA